MARRLRLTSGIDVLDAWTDAAGYADAATIADALFTIVERTVYRAYPVIDDSRVARELVVVVRDDLAVRIRLADVETFGIVFIGTPAQALELHRAPAAESPAGTN
ncbi:DUF6235 family protein [Actinophytocola glycyrrhizae]|uniref:DUF6235 family protein n=1 Tax=Actinophytocola glycyrrhizae TaxID=2044873 RepID=A0ABV9RU99_9PSEU